MRRLLLATLALIVSAAGASADDFIRYYPPTAATAAGVADPGGNGLMARTASNTSVSRTITSSTLVVSNGDGVAGNPTLDIDTSVTPQFTSGTGAVPATGSVGTFYFETDSNRFYTYPSTNTEHWVPSIAPASIAHGDVFFVDTNLQLARLGAGTSGYFLKTLGAGADPQWAAAGGSFDPGTQFSLYEEFCGGTTTTGQIGSTGFLFAAINSGTVAFGTEVAAHMCLFSILDAAGDNSGASLRPNTTAAVASHFNAVDWSLDTVIVSSSYAAAAVYFGVATLLDPALMSSGVVIRHDSDKSDSTFMFELCNAASAAGCQAAGNDANNVVVASTITPVDGTFYRLRIDHCLTCGPAGVEQIKMRVNNETGKTFCSSGCDATLALFSTALSFPTYIWSTRDTNGSRHSEIDYFYWTETLPARY